MNKVNLKEVFDNKELLQELLIQENIEDAQKVCHKYNVDLSIEELKNIGDLVRELTTKGDELSQEQLDKVVAGASVGQISCRIAGAIAGTIMGSAAGASLGYYPAIASKKATDKIIDTLDINVSHIPSGKSAAAAVGFVGGAVAGGAYGYKKGDDLYNAITAWWNKKR